jgi:hypothetical protein
MHCRCPYCSQKVVQTRNYEGPNFCQKCNKLFVLPPPKKIPPWVLGVLVILTANWQILYFLNA